MCEFCGYEPCKTRRGKLGDLKELSPDDWWLVHDFVRYVQLPFIHRLIVRARKREGLSPKTGKSED